MNMSRNQNRGRRRPPRRNYSACQPSQPVNVHSEQQVYLPYRAFSEGREIDNNRRQFRSLYEQQTYRPPRNSNQRSFNNSNTREGKFGTTHYRNDHVSTPLNSTNNFSQPYYQRSESMPYANYQNNQLNSTKENIGGNSAMHSLQNENPGGTFNDGREEYSSLQNESASHITGPQSFLEAQEQFDQFLRRKKPTDLIIEYRQKVEELAQKSIERNLKAIEHISSWKNTDAENNIPQAHEDNLHKQRDEFESYVTKVKQNLSSLSTLDNYDIMRKAAAILDNVKSECKLFNRFLPGYSLKGKVVSKLEENQVVIITSEPTYYLNVVLPILLKKAYPQHLLLCCEANEMLSSSLKTNVTNLYPENTGGQPEIEFFSADEMLKFVSNNPLMTRKEKDFISICRLPLKRSIIMDLMLSDLRDLLEDQTNCKLILLLPPYDNSLKYEAYFSDMDVDIIVPTPLSLPVTTVWKNDPLLLIDNYTKDVVTTIISIHIMKEEGDIMAFLPTLADAKSSLVDLLKQSREFQIDNIEGFILHENSLNNTWLNMCLQKETPKRTVFFVTDCAESFIIPTVRYIIDCGLKKERIFDTNKKLEVLTNRFISVDKAKLRKKLAGSFNNGTCYRLYNKENFCKEMHASEYPEILTVDPVNAVLKLFQYQPNSATILEFVESIPLDTKDRALTQLKKSNAISDNTLTPLGESMIKLSFPPIYSKLISVGIEWDLAYEAIILVAFFSVKGRVFQFDNDAKLQMKIDAIKLQLIQGESDTLSYIYIYKQWLENDESISWCEKYFINSETLKFVHEKVLSICKDVGEKIKHITPKFNQEKNTTKLLLELLFDCFKKNLCVFTGHYRSGYRMLSSRCISFLHPSSLLCQTEDLPQFIIFDHMISTKRDFLVHITTIPTDMVMNALTTQQLEFDYSDMFENTLVEKVIEPVGERIIKQVLLGKKGQKLKIIEQEIKAILADESIVIEPSVEKGRITVFASKTCIDNAAQVVDDIIKKQFENILNSEEVRILEFKRGPVTIPIELKWLKGGKVKSLKVMCNKPLSVANHSQADDPAENVPYSIKQSINLTWIRRKCTGKATIKFSPAHFPIARRLSMKKILLLGAEVFITSNESKNHLILSGVPTNAVLDEVEYCLKAILPPDIMYKRVELEYEPPFQTSENQLQEIKKIVENACQEHTKLIDFTIIVPEPKDTATIMKAYVNVPNDEIIVSAAESLSVNLNAFKGLASKPVYSSLIKYSHKICEVSVSRLKEKLTELENMVLERFPSSKWKEPFKFNIFPFDENLVNVKMSSNQLEIFQVLQRTIYNIFEGDILNKSFNEDIGKIFCHGGYLWLKTLETSDSHIIPDCRNKSIRLYGSKKICHTIKQRILQFLLDSESEAVKDIPLATKGDNRILLKTLLIEYGVNLENLISSCELRSAVLNIKACTLTLHGNRDSIEKAETVLKELASSIDLSSFSERLDDAEICPVCACPALNLTYRLEICGHLYCCECIQGLIDQAQIPIQCCFEGCNKEIILDDVCKILGDDRERIEVLLEKSMKKFIEEQQNEFYYCPAPDCSMFFRKRDILNSKHNCPLCLNDICTKCNVVYHQGFSCEMYQGSKNDPDFSFKIWQKNSEECKQCPKCKTAIQKDGGCDHMTCSTCQSHFCWVCVQEFSSARAVYEHIPFCTKYKEW